MLLSLQQMKLQEHKHKYGVPKNNEKFNLALEQIEKEIKKSQNKSTPTISYMKTSKTTLIKGKLDHKFDISPCSNKIETDLSGSIDQVSQ